MALLVPVQGLSRRHPRPFHPLLAAIQGPCSPVQGASSTPQLSSPLQDRCPITTPATEGQRKLTVSLVRLFLLLPRGSSFPLSLFGPSFPESSSFHGFPSFLYFLFHSFLFPLFLVATKRLYMRVCPSVGWMDGPSDGPSVTCFFRMYQHDGN